MRAVKQDGVSYVALFEVGLLDDFLRYSWVLENVLAEVCVHFEAAEAFA